MWLKKGLATTLVTTVAAAVLAACGQDSESAACSALESFNVATLQAQILGAVRNELTPAEQDELKQSAAQLRSAARDAEANLKNALNQAALVIDDAANKQPDVNAIMKSFGDLGKEVTSSCGLAN